LFDFVILFLYQPLGDSLEDIKRNARRLTLQDVRVLIAFGRGGSMHKAANRLGAFQPGNFALPRVGGTKSRVCDLARGRTYVRRATNMGSLFEDGVIVAAGAKSRWTRRRGITLDELVNESWRKQFASPRCNLAASSMAWCLWLPRSPPATGSRLRAPPRSDDAQLGP
jgi:hypothetical protein